MRWPTYAPVPLRLRASLTRVPENERGYVAGKLAGVPPGYLDAMLDRYLQKYELDGQRAANLFCFDVEGMFPPRGIGHMSDDDELLRLADAITRQVKQMLGSIAATSSTAIRARLEGIARRHGVRMPKVSTLGAVIARMTREHWWRKQLRRRLSEVEHGAIQAGLVHVRAGVYVSNEAFRRFRLQRERVARTLEETDAVNLTTGQVLPLADLIAHSVSNPKVRRAEMMTRLRGMERYATGDGLIGMFYTFTCPSRMHARLAPSGAPNPKYDATSPEAAQRYMVRLWAKVRAALDRRGVGYFGLRVAEPHHDATPHWHMLLFVRAGDETQLTETLRSYALQVDGDEAGAAEHRFKVERIDPGKGGAVAYVAKYVAKNIDGEHVGQDTESGTPATQAAQRIEAWARLHRIRQFQFFGTPSVIPWRELRRLRVLPEGTEGDWSALWTAADAGEWCDYMQAIRAGALDVAPVMESRESMSYPGELVDRVRGVRLRQAGRQLELRTRDDQWELRRRQPVKAVYKLGPWTRVNNCTVQRAQALTRKRPTDFSALRRGLKGGRDLSLASLGRNLRAVDTIPVSSVSEETRRELRRAIKEVSTNERAGIPLHLRAEHRIEHPAPASSRHRDRAQRESSSLAPENETDLRASSADSAPGLAQLHRGGAERIQHAARGEPSATAHAEEVENRRSSGPSSTDERLATGLESNGCRERYQH